LVIAGAAGALVSSVMLSAAEAAEVLPKASVCVAEMHYNPDGTIGELPWWEDGKPVDQLGTLDPYQRNEAETICWSEGVKSEPSSQGGMNVYPTRDGAYLMVKGASFGAQSPSSFIASVAGQSKSGSKGGGIELRLDRVDGPLVGTLPVEDSGGQWKTETIPVSGVTGTRDLFFVFRDSSLASVFKFGNWKFDKKSAPQRMFAPTPPVANLPGNNLKGN